MGKNKTIEKWMSKGVEWCAKQLWVARKHQVKKAEWITEGCYCMEIGICSNCGIGTDEFKKFKYCPNCGAKMGVKNGG